MSWKRLEDKQLQQRLKIRARIVQMIRGFFISEGFLEVETPVVVPAAGQEPYLNPLRTKVWDEHGHTREAFLITSPEYAHKKLLAGGFEKTFEITRAFRAGESWGGLHNPEFTMLEWYRANADYTAIMEDAEKMVQFVAQHIFITRHSERLPAQAGSEESPAPPKADAPRAQNAGAHMRARSFANAQDDKRLITYQGYTIDLSSPWRRLSVCEAWEQYVPGFKCTDLLVRANLCTLAKRRGYKISVRDSYDDIFFKIFLTEIEPKLGFSKPTILYDYPASMASLARVRPPLNPPLNKGEKEGVAERFEVYIAGMELGNAFSELNDAKEQRRRFMEEAALRKKLGKELIPLDEDFLEAVGYMPPSAGIAFGVDRLVMLLTNAARIEDVLAFPAGELFDSV